MKTHIICFGDSNTHGFNAEDGNRFDENQRWTCLLQEKLGQDYLVIEEGLGGRTTCFTDPVSDGLCGLDYITPCIMSHKPVDLLIIMLGTNDSKERFGVTPACIGLGMKRLVLKAMATVEAWNGKQPNILIVCPKNIEKNYESTGAMNTMGAGCAEKSEGLAQVYEEIAAQLGCRFFDANTVVSEYNHYDYMHLTKEGHLQLAEAFAQQIPKIVN